MCCNISAAIPIAWPSPPSPGLLHRWPGHLSLARFGSPQSTEAQNPIGRQVLTSLLTAHPSARLRAHSTFWLSGQPPAHQALPLCSQLLASTPQPQAEHHASSTEDAPGLYRCPNCGGPMKVIERLTTADIQLRSPPVVTAAA